MKVEKREEIVQGRREVGIAIRLVGTNTSSGDSGQCK